MWASRWTGSARSMTGSGASGRLRSGAGRCSRLQGRAGVKVGLRFTITDGNAHHLPAMLDLCRDEGVDKFYLSHLVCGSRRQAPGEDTAHDHTRRAMDLLIDRAWGGGRRPGPFEVVTGNNDADAVYFLRWAEARFPPPSPICDHASGGMGRQFIGPRRRQYRPAGPASIPIPTGRITPWVRSRNGVFSKSGPGRPDPLPPCAPVRARSGRCGACAYQTGLRRQYPHPGAATDRRSMGGGPGLLSQRGGNRRRRCRS